MHSSFDFLIPQIKTLSNKMYKDILVIYLIHYWVWVPAGMGTIKSVSVSI